MEGCDVVGCVEKCIGGILPFSPVYLCPKHYQWTCKVKPIFSLSPSDQDGVLQIRPPFDYEDAKKRQEAMEKAQKSWYDGTYSRVDTIRICDVVGCENTESLELDYLDPYYLCPKHAEQRLENGVYLTEDPHDARKDAMVVRPIQDEAERTRRTKEFELRQFEDEEKNRYNDDMRAMGYGDESSSSGDSQAADPEEGGEEEEPAPVKTIHHDPIHDEETAGHEKDLAIVIRNNVLPHGAIVRVRVMPTGEEIPEDPNNPTVICDKRYRIVTLQEITLPNGRTVLESTEHYLPIRAKSGLVRRNAMANIEQPVVAIQRNEDQHFNEELARIQEEERKAEEQAIDQQIAAKEKEVVEETPPNKRPRDEEVEEGGEEQPLPESSPKEARPEEEEANE